MSNKIAIVTGGANGIGKATCELLSIEGYTVVVSDIDEAGGQQTVDALRASGGTAQFYKTDVSNYEDVKGLINSTIKDYGHLDLLVNNAGTGAKEYAKAADHSLEDWDMTVGVNQAGVFYGMKVALGHMAERRSGSIVNIASMAGLRGNITGMAYTASKFAVVGMTKSAALEYGSRNIRVNCICPGFTKTKLFNDSMLGLEEMKEKLRRTVTLKRFGEPSEIAEAVVWLGSDKASYITGHALEVCGGMP